jgi:hypothetical protein
MSFEFLRVFGARNGNIHEISVDLDLLLRAYTVIIDRNDADIERLGLRRGDEYAAARFGPSWFPDAWVRRARYARTRVSPVAIGIELRSTQ